jgi:hypothetical protein
MRQAAGDDVHADPERRHGFLECVVHENKHET